MEVNCFQILLIDVTCLKGGTQRANKKMKTRIYATPTVEGLGLTVRLEEINN